MNSSSLSLPRTLNSTSKSRPRRANALPKIGITTSILSSHLHAASASSFPQNDSFSTRNATDRTSTHNFPRDLDAAHEYALGRYPAGSGQIQVGEITGKTPTQNSSTGKEKEQRVLRPVNLEPGRAVCVVGYLELFTPAHEEDKDATDRKGQSEDVDDNEEESASASQRRRAWEEVKGRGWVVNALQVMNVPVYEPVESVGGSSINLDTLSGKEVNERKGQKEVNAEASWGRRSGLERYD
ncbi:hypothetical protein HD553DRAFT_14964 [Filobasidium floriforme]|uniref:uncharacterized protein n=1 Tax=Filobasidium floriforme TaxID=5210 RepID=UPI001E8D32A9|nr:uncharacterized protein HD553DRAFT_14964 [Filobasidium floriforme]KAH8090757.1 hypothetical protein HD553DRAFT_14964 [Filobasidium floriforme]